MKSLMGLKLGVPKTLQQAVIHYADEYKCLDLVVSARWPNGLCCPRCGDLSVKLINRRTRQQTRTVWRCYGCKKQFSVKVGTIFEDSPLPLSKWLVALWHLVSSKNGISSCEIARAIGVTQKTAWFMLQRLRLCVTHDSLDMFERVVEADETYVGGLEENKHAGKKLNLERGTVGKSIVMGVLERGEGAKKSRIRAGVIHNTKRGTLHGKLRESVKEFATIYTDSLPSYRGLPKSYTHQFVDHAVRYALGRVHTNGVENFWALLKRCLKGTYVAVQPFHLKRYIDEMVYRFNHRGGDDRDRFVTALSMIEGKRLTYDELTRSYEAYYDQVLPRG